MTKLAIPHQYEVVPNIAHSPEGIYKATGVRNLQFLTNNLTVAALPGFVNESREASGFRFGKNPAGSKCAVITNELSKAAFVTLNLHTASGKLLRVLASGWAERGRHSIRLELKNSGGTPVPPGLYLCPLRAGDSRKMSLLIPISNN